VDPKVLDWLLEGDPAVAWQTQRDLLDAPAKEWEATQRRVATEGWGARLMSEREPGGRWDGGLYTPKWTSTTYTLLQLWRMGLPRDNPQAQESVALLMQGRIWAPERGDKVALEECVAGFALALSSWFTIDDPERDRLIAEILERQLEDGGWNCRASRDRFVTHSSFHTSMNVLEGLNEYRLSRGKHSAEVEAAEVRAREFFCRHSMYLSHRTGSVPDERMGRLPFPPHWHHDFLRGLDYFRASGASRDHRLGSAVQRLDSYRGEHGKWPIHRGYSGKVWFNMETGGSPSRWNTLRALRVLRWWGSA
jgi:hypothetical protein